MKADNQGRLSLITMHEEAQDKSSVIKKTTITSKYSVTVAFCSSIWL